MAVHNLGYRSWSGELAPAWTRFVVITTTGVRRAWTSRWLRRSMMFAWLPALYFAAAFFVLERGLEQTGSPEQLIGLIEDSPFMWLVQGVDTTNRESLRHTLWARLLYFFFLGPQGYLMVMMVGIIAPPLISQDVRSRAFLLYFSRPIDRWEYILGKASTLWIYLTLISAAPALVLYLLGVLLSPSLGVVASTWDLPFRVLVASAFLMIPTSALALCLSSMTQESRVAGFAWFAIWILGFVAAAFITTAEMAMQGGQPGGPYGGVDAPISKWSYLSPINTLSIAQTWVFGFGTLQRAMTAIVLLIAITVVSVIILYRKVSAPMRA